LKYAAVFPKFRFDERHRPTPAQLVNFIRQARTINPSHTAFMERVVAFDLATRRTTISHYKIVGALLEYLNGGKKHLITSYDSENSSYFVWSNQANPRLLCASGGSNECVLHFLRFLRFKTLKLEFPGKFDLSDLQNLSIEILDLRNCGKLTLTRPVSLPALSTVLVHPRQIDSELLHRRIQTSERLKIVETP